MLPEVLNKNQKTPLLLAALSGHADVCDLLSPLKLARCESLVAVRW